VEAAVAEEEGVEEVEAVPRIIPVK